MDTAGAGLKATKAPAPPDAALGSTAEGDVMLRVSTATRTGAEVTEMVAPLIHVHEIASVKVEPIVA